ncbi:MAG: 3-hydroxyacyl-[acyl-carrier-protein] dehydratase FabZ [Candidatus Wallbacteria bacterium]|nr:3-hydroxyacyl-[acyl-carrier-protein] dehydratase FabZ [Candidatus Wallbacteria bacterium]
MFRPLHLIDRLVEMAPPARVRAIKAPSFGEQLYEDHFAGFPIMPGVLMVESMVQSAQWLTRATEGFPAADYPVARMERVVFSDYVRPGSVMDVEVERNDGLDFRGTVKVAGKKVASARFTLRRCELDAGRPAIRRAMERLIDTFECLGGRDLLGAGSEVGS